MQGGSLCNTSTVLAHHKHCVVGAGAGAGNCPGRFSVHQAIVIALFLVNLFTYTTSITTSTVLLVLALAGDGECLISCRAGHMQSKGPCKLGMVGWTRFSSCFGFWRGNQCLWRENLLYQFQRKNYDLSMSGLWSSVHFRGRISYTY